LNKKSRLLGGFFYLGEDFELFFTGRLGQPLIDTGKQEIFSGPR
jgi:hypothetical protein